MLLLIPLLPFVGFLVLAAFGRKLAKTVSGTIACATMLGSFAVSVLMVTRLLGFEPASRVIVEEVFTWLSVGRLRAPFSLALDPLAALMILVVTGIGSLIHIYSTSYMHDEPDGEYARYFSYLNLFAAFMLVLVLGSNLLVMFIGWEGVGLCSYLLIGFWFEKSSAASAGKKAFIVNRIGDFGFILGILLVIATFGTIEFREVARLVSQLQPEAAFGTVSIITLLLFIGATGKSAQIPLYVWLPDAMEGPTPVSALIHAATMVTAGVYMIGRNAELFSHAPETLTIVAVVGAATALMAGTIGLVQTDIKRVLAYSTVSQLGYMFLAMGVGAYTAGIFHLFTHAFFKALLFLGSGAVIHALGGEQDLRRMGGLRSKLPLTYWTFLIGALAIAGVPGLSGFFSKDEILFRTFASGHPWLWAMASVTALLTAIYMFRLVFLAFHGTAGRAEALHAKAEPALQAADDHAHAEHGHLHDAPPAMAVALVVLAIGSIVVGYLGVPHALGGRNLLEQFLGPSLDPRLIGQTTLVVPSAAEAAAAEDVLHATESLELGLMAVSTVIALAGIGIAAMLFLDRREMAAALAARFPGVHRLLLNKYYVDELYDRAIVEPVRSLSDDGLWQTFDVGVIDGTVNGIGGSVSGTASALRRLQSGSVRAYGASLIFGGVLILAYWLW